MLACNVIWFCVVLTFMVTICHQILAGSDAYFTYDHTFGPSTLQENIYDECVLPLIDGIIVIF